MYIGDTSVSTGEWDDRGAQESTAIIESQSFRSFFYQAQEEKGGRKMYTIAVPTAIAGASCFSPVCSFNRSFTHQRIFSRKTLAANCNSARLTAKRHCSTKASSGDVTTRTAKAPITFQIGETSLTLPFSSQAAKGLSDAIDKLLITFKEREKATRPQRWQSLEFHENGDGGVSFEVFCNPNAYANAFQAKVLITVKDDNIKLTTEGQLSTLKSDVDQYVEKVC